MISKQSLEEIVSQITSPSGPPIRSTGDGEMSFSLAEPVINTTGTYDGGCGYDTVDNQEDPVNNPLNQLIALKHRFDEIILNIITKKESNPSFSMVGVQDCLRNLSSAIEGLESNGLQDSVMGVDLNDGIGNKAIILIPLA